MNASVRPLYPFDRMSDAKRSSLAAACLSVIRRAAGSGDRDARALLDAYANPDAVRRAEAICRVLGAPGSPARNARIRRARVAGAFGAHSDAEWAAVLDRFRHRCAQCGEGGRLEKDHIVPLCAGGSDMAINLQPLCKPCNSAKSGRILPGTQLGIFDRVTVRSTRGQMVRRERHQ